MESLATATDGPVGYGCGPGPVPVFWWSDGPDLQTLPTTASYGLIQTTVPCPKQYRQRSKSPPHTVHKIPPAWRPALE